MASWGSGVVSLLAALWVQLSVSVGSEWPHCAAAPLAFADQLPLLRL